MTVFKAVLRQLPTGIGVIFRDRAVTRMNEGERLSSRGRVSYGLFCWRRG